MSLPIFIFLSLGFIWGSTFIYMKMAVELITPMQVVFARFALGFLPVIGYGFYRNYIKMEHMRYFHHFMIMAIFVCVYYYGFVIGSGILPSGIAGALSGAIPIFSFILTMFFIQDEDINIYKIAGVFVGFLGVVVIANPFSSFFDSNIFEGVAYLLLGSLAAGSSFVYAKKYLSPLKIPVAALTSYQLGLALIIFALFTDFSGIEKITADPNAFWGLILGLGILGTGLAYIFYYYIIEAMGAITASSVTYLPPLVALIIGALIIKEDITMTDYIGTSLIISGVFLLRRK